MNAVVYTDGSGTTGGPAGIGFVAYLGDTKTEVSGSLPLANATNQQAEILAAAYALHKLAEDVGSLEIEIRSDSEYVVLGMNDKTRKRKKNLAHWQRLEDAVAQHDSVVFAWTKGHAGTEGNERADALAGRARAQAKNDATAPLGEAGVIALLVATFDAREIVDADTWLDNRPRRNVATWDERRNTSRVFDVMPTAYDEAARASAEWKAELERERIDAEQRGEQMTLGENATTKTDTPPSDTDCAFLLDVLDDGEEHTLNEILARSFAERGCGLTVHSRASDLRNRYGYDVEWCNVPGVKRGDGSVYRLKRATLAAPTDRAA
jgi:ribonuclease HI